MKYPKIVKFIKFNILLGFILGLLGLAIYLIVNPSLKQRAKRPDFYLYETINNKHYECFYSRNKRDAFKVINYYDSSSCKFNKPLVVGKTIRSLPVNANVKVLDTINENTIKFYKLSNESIGSYYGFVGYTYISNIHETPSK